MSPRIQNVFSISPDGVSEAYLNNLTSDAQLLKGVLPQPQRGTVAAYNIAGKLEFPVSTGLFTNHIEKFPFSISGASVTDVGEIGRTFLYHQPFQSATNAYMLEGDVGTSPTSRNNTGVEKFPFAVPVATSTTLSYSDMNVPSPPPSNQDASAFQSVIGENSKAYFIEQIANYHSPYIPNSMFDPSWPALDPSGVKSNQIAFKFTYASETIATVPGTHTVLYSSNSATVDTTGGPTPFGNQENEEGSFGLNGNAWIGDSDAYFSGDASLQVHGDPLSLLNMYGFITKMPFASEAFSVADTRVVTRDLGGDPTANPDAHPISIFTNFDGFYPQATASGPTDGYYMTPTPSVGGPKNWNKWPYSNYTTSTEVIEYPSSARLYGFASSTSETDVFITGGRSTPAVPTPTNTFDTIQKFPFSLSSSGTLTDVGELINTRYFSAMSVD